MSVHHCLESVGIAQLSDWDVLAFVYRHGVSLTSAEQIARLMGYESGVVGGALDRLERGEIIGRSRPSRGVRFYRAVVLTDPERRRCLEYLISVADSRSGRLLLTRELKSVGPESEREEPTPRNHKLEGSGYA
jgi:DNA-binding MarR family transcriptional regulator